MAPPPAWVVARMRTSARRPSRAFSLAQMLAFGARPSQAQLLQAAYITADEVAIRLARRSVEIDESQFGVSGLPVARLAKDIYARSCQELFEFSDQIEELCGSFDITASTRPTTPIETTSPTKGWFTGAWSKARGALLNPPASWQTTSALANVGIVGMNASVSANVAVPAVSTLHHSHGRQLSTFTSDNAASIMPTTSSLSLATLGYGDANLPESAIKAAPRINSHFTTLIQRFVMLHRPIVLMTAYAANQLTKNHPYFDQRDPTVQNFLIQFHQGRIGMRLLLAHHMALAKPLPMNNTVGVICTRTQIEDIANEAAMEADEICMTTYDVSPQIVIEPLSPVDDKDPGLVYVPSHLQHMLFEILKNAQRAVIEAEEAKVGRGNAERKKMPPIVISWENLENTVRITVTDQGVGISKDKVDEAFEFHSSTAEQPLLDAPEFDNVWSRVSTGYAPMAGFGYGLPLSRVYARFLGGDLSMASDGLGHGTRVTIDLRKQWKDTDVVIPASPIHSEPTAIA